MAQQLNNDPLMTTIHPEQILRDLSRQWAQLDQEQANSGGVLRACAMTLIVTAKDEADAEQVRQMLGVLMHEHPARAVILTGHEGADFDARVFAECWKPFGSNQQICAEGIEIVSGSSNFEDAAQLLVPLKVPDLPTVLWCRGTSAFYLRTFDMLFPLADKLIFDSSTVSGAAAALTFLRSLKSRGHHVADLHWTRLTGWREILAHLFDDEAMKPGDVSSVRVTYGGATPSTCTLYFASWVEQALPRARVSLSSGAGEPGLRAVTFSNKNCELSLGKNGTCIEVNGCNRHYRSSLPPVDETSLMREELKFPGSDPVFDRVLA